MPPNRDLCGQTLEQTYRLERLIGEGAMGAVYEASHARLSRRFAVKVLTLDITAGSADEAAARFSREAEVTSRLKHPNIVDIIDFNHTPDGEPYIVMELLEGTDLERWLEQRTRLTPEQAAPLLRQIAAGLQAAHDKGIIHRDLKPSNMFICPQEDGTELVKLVDFGLAKLADASVPLTDSIAVLGTPWYMSPEQADGRAAEATLQTDVFALGIILYELLTGQVPFKAGNLFATLHKIAAEEPPPMRSLGVTVPPALESVVLRALSKRPEERHASAAALARDFGDALGPLEEPHLGEVPTQELERVRTATLQPNPGEVPTQELERVCTATHQPNPGVISTQELEHAHTAIHPASPGAVMMAAAEATRAAAPAGPRPTEARREPGQAATQLISPRDPVRRQRLLGLGIFVGLFAALVAASVWIVLALMGDEPRPTPSRSAPAAPPESAIQLTAPPDHGLLAAPTTAADQGLATPDLTSAVPPTRSALRTLRLSTRPAGAEVFIGQQSLGRTPLRGVTIPAEPTLLVVRKRGHRPRRLQLPQGELPLHRQVTLRPLPRRRGNPGVGTLLVTALVDGAHVPAQVYLDGRPVGQTSLFLQGVRAGPHRLTVRKAGFAPHHKRVTIRAGRKNRFFFNLRR